jgi:hypothetical protein
VREFEAKYGWEMPTALRHYYKSTRLISLLQAALFCLSRIWKNAPAGLA